MALGRRSRQPAISALCITYIEVLRGVPLISILFMGNIMLQLFMPQSLPPIDRVVRVMVAITLFTAAYMAEIARGGLQNANQLEKVLLREAHVAMTSAGSYYLSKDFGENPQNLRMSYALGKERIREGLKRIANVT